MDVTFTGNTTHTLPPLKKSITDYLDTNPRKFIWVISFTAVKNNNNKKLITKRVTNDFIFKKGNQQSIYCTCIIYDIRVTGVVSGFYRKNDNRS